MTKLFAIGCRETGVHFSPYVWAIIMALKHKKIEYDLEILGMNEANDKVSELTNGKWRLVPLLQFDDGTCVYDSFNIALELERRYPDAPKLFPTGPSNAKFYHTFSITYNPPIFKRLLFSLKGLFSEEGQERYRKVRESELGCTLEEYVGDVDSHLESADTFFKPLREALKHAPYLEGSQPTYSDYIMYGRLQMIRVLEPDDFDIYVTNHKDGTLKKWHNLVERNLGSGIESA